VVIILEKFAKNMLFLLIFKINGFKLFLW